MQRILLGLLLVGLVSAQENSATPKPTTGTATSNPSPETSKPKATVTTTCPCGRAVQGRIIGGREAASNQFPFMAALTLTNKKPFCGATIITKTHAVTAAQCTFEMKNRITELRLLVGAHDFTEAVNGQFIPVNSTIEHYLFKPEGKNEHDIAIVVLERALVISNFVMPACVVHKWMDLDKLSFIVLGWGITRNDGPRSKVLKQVLLSVIDSETCFRYYPGELHRFKSQFCTYQKGKDSCQGDSGGPLFGFDFSINRFIVVGLVSFGRACASDSPSVNINLGYYLNWMKGIVQKTRDADEEICHKI